MRRILLCLALVLAPAASAAEPLRVVATVPPVHGLVAAVMDGTGEPGLLIPAEASPHHAALRPSAAKALAEAQLVFLVGAGLEGGMTEAIETLAPDAAIMHLAEMDGLDPIPLDRTNDHGHGHEHDGAIDPHLWLDPAIASAWTREIAEALAAADPPNAALYRANGERLRQRIDSLTEELQGRLAAVRTRPYAVYHDAFRYFERRFGLGARAVVSGGDARQPGPRHLAEIRARLARLDRPCLFAEPQHDRRLVETLARDSGARVGLLDPLGVDLPPGPDFYPTLLTSLADGFIACLAAQ